MSQRASQAREIPGHQTKDDHHFHQHQLNKHFRSTQRSFSGTAEVSSIFRIRLDWANVRLHRGRLFLVFLLRNGFEDNSELKFFTSLARWLIRGRSRAQMRDVNANPFEALFFLLPGDHKVHFKTSTTSRKCERWKKPMTSVGNEFGVIVCSFFVSVVVKLCVCFGEVSLLIVSDTWLESGGRYSLALLI